MDTHNPLLALMVERSNTAPKRLVAPGPTHEQLQLIFSAAAQAPDHGRIRPWRFVLVPSHKREDLGQAFVQALQMRDIQAGPAQLQAAYEKAFRAPCLMLGVLDTAPVQAEIEASERLISLGCAVQNMLLMAQTFGLGSGITSGKAMNAPILRSLFQLTEHEQGVCFLNFGTVSTTKPARSRPVVEEFVSSL